MKSRPLFCLSALAALLACMPKPVPPPIVDIAAMPCATAMVTSGAMPLLFDPKGRDEKTTTAILDGNSRCIQDTDGGRRLYQVFALPSTELSYILSVRSSPWADTILAPRALLLGGDGSIIRSTSHADFVFRREQLSALMRSHPGEVYLAVTSDSDVLGKEITRVVEAVHSSAAALPNGGAFIWYSGSDSSQKLVLSVAGRVEVIVTPFPPDDPKK